MTALNAKSVSVHSSSLKAGLANAAKILQTLPTELRGPYQVNLATKSSKK